MQITDWILHLEGLSDRRTEDRAPVDLASAVPPDPTLLCGVRGEQVLWRAATAGTGWNEGTEVDGLLRDRAGKGSLLATDAFLAIEVWAECELAALHGLHRLLRLARVPDDDWRRVRLAEAAAWHLEHTQPDNSTNRPWALHVYLLREDPTGESRLYAETLLHNACASSARDEPLTRWILADAARELRLALDAPQRPR
jgi:hypothetical protein